MSKRIAVLVGVLSLAAGCGQQVPRHDARQGTPVLRAVWRDGTRHMLVVLPGADGQMPHGDCTAPLLIDDASGGVRQIAPAEAAALVKHMQLAGAVRGTCP